MLVGRGPRCVRWGLIRWGRWGDGWTIGASGFWGRVLGWGGSEEGGGVVCRKVPIALETFITRRTYVLDDDEIKFFERCLIQF